VRSRKKLPAKTAQVSYALEYGTDTLEIHEDAVQKGQKCAALRRFAWPPAPQAAAALQLIAPWAAR